MMAQPPTTSFASAYGPSTRLTSPWRTTKWTASSVPYRPPPSRNTPLAARSPMCASIASNSACGGVPTPSSILTNPMKRGILTTPTGCWGCFSHARRTAAGFFDISLRSFFRPAEIPACRTYRPQPPLRSGLLQHGVPDAVRYAGQAFSDFESPTVELALDNQLTKVIRGDEITHRILIDLLDPALGRHRRISLARGGVPVIDQVVYRRVQVLHSRRDLAGHGRDRSVGIERVAVGLAYDVLVAIEHRVEPLGQRERVLLVDGSAERLAELQAQ